MSVSSKVVAEVRGSCLSDSDEDPALECSGEGMYEGQAMLKNDEAEDESSQTRRRQASGGENELT